ncbi:MAG: beta-lactamase family protein [Sediminibacterium sp.]|nr:beta-lactamase family protein [Sediminibacterium sp.]
MSVRSCLSCMKVSLVLIFMLFFQFLQAQYNFTEVDRKLEAVKKELGGNAVAMIYKDGKIIYQKAMGDFNAKTQAPVASCSKWLTAALVMSFVDEGRLSLDDRISKYLPVFTKYSKGFITIRQCLAHLTGIESEPIRLATLLSRRKFSTLEEEVDDFAAKKEIESNPGLEFRYSSIGLNIAGRILEVMTRRSFEQLMQERITRPLMMRNTSFASFSAVNPSGGAISTASDYMNFLSMILNKGMFNGKQILSEKAILEMQTPQTTSAMIKYAPKAAAGYNYGFGEWILQTDENGKATVVASPGLFGTWPMVDLCRGYACIFFTKGSLGEEKRDIYLDIKTSIDAVIPSTCK